MYPVLIGTAVVQKESAIILHYHMNLDSIKTQLVGFVDMSDSLSSDIFGAIFAFDARGLHLRLSEK